MTMQTTILVDGQDAKIGDFIGFKTGIERCGKLIAIKGSMLILSVYDSETGDRHEVVQDVRRCWKE
jgi:hypothetical protein